jgi:hypothetical protein
MPFNLIHLTSVRFSYMAGGRPFARVRSCGCSWLKQSKFGVPHPLRFVQRVRLSFSPARCHSLAVRLASEFQVARSFAIFQAPRRLGCGPGIPTSPTRKASGSKGRGFVDFFRDCKALRMLHFLALLQLLAGFLGFHVFSPYFGLPPWAVSSVYTANQGPDI